MLIGCSNSTETLKFATGSVGGVYYPLGGGISETLTDNIEGTLVNAYTGNASVSNSNLINLGEVDLALVQSNVASWAIDGVDMFDEPLEDLRGIASLYSEVIQVIVRKDAGIDSFNDLVGKNVSVGKIDSGNYFDAINLMNAHGIDLSSMNAKYLSFGEAFDMMINEELDAVFVTSGIPTSSVALMASKVDIKLLEIDENIMQDLVESFPYYTIEIVPAETYPGSEKDIFALSTRALWICNKDLDDDLVYEMLKVYYEELNLLKTIHVSLDQESKETALKGMSIPIHPGALKFYKEIGLEVDN
jgi:TRAP transporter TAXI family solute receptor